MKIANNITVRRSEYGYPNIRIEQDHDLIAVDYDKIKEFVEAVGAYAVPPIEEPEPAPEKWYVVLKNSNYRLTNPPNVPTTFTTYEDARIYARNFGGLERTYCPISADEYERAFGKHANIVEEAEPSAHITAGGENLRMMRMVARANVQQLRRDAAYEEGRIAALDSIMED